MTFAEWVKSKRACEDAYKAHAHQTEQEFWDTCERGDWMLWVVKNKYPGVGWPDHKTLVLISCQIARSVLKFVKAGEDSPRLAIEAAERWAENPTEGNRTAADAAGDAANAAYAYAAAAAAANAAYAAADAANAAAHAANAAAHAAADAAEKKLQADIIRTLWPKVGT